MVALITFTFKIINIGNNPQYMQMNNNESVTKRENQNKTLDR